MLMCRKSGGPWDLEIDAADDSGRQGRCARGKWYEERITETIVEK